MKAFGLLGSAAALAVALPMVANAAPIAAGSSLSLNGTDSFTPTSVTFNNPANLGASSGSFAGLGSCSNCATMTSFTQATGPFTMFTVINNGLTASLRALTTSFVYTAGALGRLDVTGSGVLSLTGFDDTTGNYALTTQGTGLPTVTFSVTSVAVPEPASMMLLGSGLLGLAVAAKRRKAR